MPFSSKSLLLLMMMNHTRVNLVASWLVYVMSGGGDGVFTALGFGTVSVVVVVVALVRTPDRCTAFCRASNRLGNTSLAITSILRLLLRGG